VSRAALKSKSLCRVGPSVIYFEDQDPSLAGYHLSPALHLIPGLMSVLLAR